VLVAITIRKAGRFDMKTIGLLDIKDLCVEVNMDKCSVFFLPYMGVVSFLCHAKGLGRIVLVAY
jgi:hypothetical protein